MRKFASPPARAITILTAAWHMLHNGELYRDLGSDYFTRQNPDRTTRRLVRQLEALGHNVTLEPREVVA
jgi:transposase